MSILQKGERASGVSGGFPFHHVDDPLVGSEFSSHNRRLMDEAVRVLLSAGADPGLTNSQSNNALDAALEARNLLDRPEVSELLLAHRRAIGAHHRRIPALDDRAHVRRHRRVGADACGLEDGPHSAAGGAAAAMGADGEACVDDDSARAADLRLS